MEKTLYSTTGLATDENIIRRMRFAYWVPKVANTHSEYVILIAFPQQQWLRERAPMLHYTYTARIDVFKPRLRQLNGTYPKDEAGTGEGRSIVVHVENFDPKESNSLSRWFPAVCSCHRQSVDGSVFMIQHGPRSN